MVLLSNLLVALAGIATVSALPYGQLSTRQRGGRNRAIPPTRMWPMPGGIPGADAVAFREAAARNRNRTAGFRNGAGNAASFGRGGQGRGGQGRPGRGGGRPGRGGNKGNNGGNAGNGGNATATAAPPAGTDTAAPPAGTDTAAPPADTATDTAAPPADTAAPPADTAAPPADDTATDTATETATETATDAPQETAPANGGDQAIGDGGNNGGNNGQNGGNGGNDNGQNGGDNGQNGGNGGQDAGNGGQDGGNNGNNGGDNGQNGGDNGQNGGNNGGAADPPAADPPAADPPAPVPDTGIKDVVELCTNEDGKTGCFAILANTKGTCFSLTRPIASNVKFLVPPPTSTCQVFNNLQCTGGVAAAGVVTAQGTVGFACTAVAAPPAA